MHKKIAIKDVGKTVRDIRGDLTQAEFATLLEISQGFLSEIETNIKEPGKKTARKLADLSGLPVGTFFN